MPQKGNPYLLQARKTFLKLKQITHPEITMERVCNYHLKRERLLTMINKMAKRYYGDSYAEVLKEKHGFEIMEHPTKVTDVVRGKFSDIYTVLSTKPELSSPGNLDIDVVGAEIPVDSIHMSVINIEQTRESRLGHALLSMSDMTCDVTPQAATNWVNKIAGGEGFPACVTSPERHVGRNPHGIVVRTATGREHCITSQEMIVRAIACHGSIDTVSVVEKCTSMIKDVFRNNSIYRAISVGLRKKDQRHIARIQSSKRLYSTLPMFMEPNEHTEWYNYMSDLILNLPFNRSGKGWARPDEMHRISISQGVRIPATACHSWSASLGVLSNMNGVYTGNFPRVFSIKHGSFLGESTLGVFSLIDIRPGMPIGVLYGNLTFSIEFDEKLARLGDKLRNCPKVNSYMILDCTDDEGEVLLGHQNPCGYINFTDKTKKKRANVVIEHVHPGLAVYYSGPRGIKRNTELLVRNV
jgi:hypothetical protein